MGDEQARHPQAALEAADLGTHREPQLGVQIGQRFVEQEQLRVPHDRAAHRDPLALPAGQLPRLAFQQGANAEQSGRLVHAAADFLARQPADAQAVGHVVEHGHVRIERVVLEHHGDVALGRIEVRDVAPAEHDPA